MSFEEYLLFAANGDTKLAFDPKFREQQAGPVAYKAVSKITGAVQYYAALPSYIDPVSWDILPLFDPPQRKPLTDDMVHRAMLALNTASCGELEPTVDEMRAALEAAHGIKGEA
jgi:hypothetical protein